MSSIKQKFTYFFTIRSKIRMIKHKDSKAGDLKGNFMYIVDHYNDGIRKIGLTTNLYARFRTYKTHSGKFKMYYFTLSDDCSKEEGNSTVLRCRETEIKTALKDYKLKYSKINEEKYSSDFYKTINVMYEILKEYLK